jgi:hypothetical protein
VWNCVSRKFWSVYMHAWCTWIRRRFEVYLIRWVLDTNLSIKAELSNGLSESTHANFRFPILLDIERVSFQFQFYKTTSHIPHNVWNPSYFGTYTCPVIVFLTTFYYFYAMFFLLLLLYFLFRYKVFPSVETYMMNSFLPAKC